MMKKWIQPSLEEMPIRTTSQQYYAASMAGSGAYIDLGTCHNDYWEGNGKTLEEAQKNNPYWSGGWGQN